MRAPSSYAKLTEIEKEVIGRYKATYGAREAHLPQSHISNLPVHERLVLLDELYEQDPIRKQRIL